MTERSDRASGRSASFLLDANRPLHRLRELWDVFPRPALGLLAVGLVIVVSIDLVKSPVRREMFVAQSALDRALYERLQGLNRTWEPREHARRLDRLVETCRSSGMIGPLERLLRHPHDPQISAALEVAQRLGEPVLAPALRLLGQAGPREHRPAAWLALHACGEVTSDDVWPVLEPAAFERDREPRSANLHAAMLRIARDLPDVGWEPFAEAMSSENELVRQVAVEAFPTPVPDVAVDRLVEMVGEAWQGESAACAADVLVQRVPIDRIGARLARLLDSDSVDPTLALDILSVESALPSQLVESVWAIALDDLRPVGVRAAAWRCLEKTRTPIPLGGDARRSQPPTDGVLRYCMARYLFVTGKIAPAVELLCDLLDRQGETPQELELDARALLCQVSHLPLSTEPDDFRAWANNHATPTAACHLAEPRIPIHRLATPPY